MNVLFAIFLGLLAGAALTVLCGRWINLFLGFFALSRPDAGIPGSRPRVVGAPLMLVVHPAPWVMLMGLPFCLYRFVFLRPTPASLWFFGALFAVAVPSVLHMVTLSRRVQKQSVGSGVWPS